MLKRHLQSFVVDGVDRVPLHAGLPLALACFVGEQVTFDVTENKEERVRQDGGRGALRPAPSLRGVISETLQTQRL